MSSTNYAGFWLRFVAYVIDYIIIYVVQSFLILPILGVMGITVATQAQNMDAMSEAEIFAMVGAFIAAMGTVILISTALSVLYYSLMEASKYQATLGKLALGLKVTDTNGNKIDFVKALIRNLGKILSAFILMIGYIMAGFTDKKQALHDIIASTLVVKK
ncbi:MAG TPA: RDD family protein [Cyclobacteriaceae bacterium]|nr:RDD family protein [Cyclobacteriaceae bacterium]